MAERFDRYRALTETLGFSQRGAARFLDVGDRISRRWANDEADVPLAVIMVLELMVKFDLRPNDVNAMAGIESHDRYDD